MTREEFNCEQRRRRAALRARGICPDCQKNRAHVDAKGKRHVCCEACLVARRERQRNAAKPPLLRLVEKGTGLAP